MRVHFYKEICLLPREIYYCIVIVSNGILSANTEPPEWEDFDEDEDVVDLRANHVLGGVFHFNLMALPPQPKTVNNWTITRSKLYLKK